MSKVNKELKVEIRYRYPDKENPAVVTLGSLLVNPSPEDVVEVYIDWDDGTYGTKVPVLVVKAQDKS